MVMHARKLPRMNDGFSEKHQAHGYENSKYSNKYRYGNHEKNRDSPSTNSLRSSSPDSRSQSPRYHKSNYYKVREKERENRDRDRDREYKDYRERDESRSPKDRRRGELRERDRDRDRGDHRDSRLHERINSNHKKEEKERLMQVGEWSEHVSSSGKKYYYNCQTQVSQWEKPTEWYDWERSHRSGGGGPSVPPPSSSNHSCKDSTIHRSQHDKSRQEKHCSIGDGYRDSREIRENERDRRDFRPDDHYDRRENRKYVQDVGTADMDISSGDSTPTSESHYDVSHHAAANNLAASSSASANNMAPSASSSSQYPFSRPKFCSSNPLPTCTTSLPNCTSTTTSMTPTPSSNNCYQHHLPGSGGGRLTVPTTSSSSVSQLLNSHPRLISLSSSAETPKNINNSSIINTSASYDPEMMMNHHPSSAFKMEASLSSNNNIGVGPPTPTHSENQEGLLDIRKIGSPNSSLNMLQVLTQTSTNSMSLTPSLGNYYKETLISHVQSWPAENIEKQCHRLSEEAHTIGSLIMTKVSADLKMARSLVRLAEIQATLHEQRILFLRAQKKELEHMKAQNCFMNDT